MHERHKVFVLCYCSLRKSCRNKFPGHAGRFQRKIGSLSLARNDFMHFHKFQHTMLCALGNHPFGMMSILKAVQAYPLKLQTTAFVRQSWCAALVDDEYQRNAEAPISAPPFRFCCSICPNEVCTFCCNYNSKQRNLDTHRKWP